MELKNLTCKCCTAPLDPAKAVGRVIRCAFCGTAFVLAREDEGKVVDLLRSGELLLDTCKFDDAFTAYQKAAELDKEEPEAYFGMALATFKVQYLKDEVNNRLQPICHEISERAFSADTNYLHALELAGKEQKKVYRERAVEIDEIRDQFNELKESGLDYDCFLCVKVSDDHGGTTQDSHETLKLYHHLKERGFTPFYSEEEIKGRSGSDYEALILYALYTSECMLLVCSDEGYLQTKWMKNEYTRFMAMIANEEKERDAITFLFRGRPVEHLPGKSGKLQGIDLTKPDAYNRIDTFVENHTPEARAKRKEKRARQQAEDEESRRKLSELEEGLKKLREAREVPSPDGTFAAQIEEQKQRQAALEERLSSIGGTGASVDSLLMRAEQELDMENTAEARRYYTRVLDIRPACGEAWWGLFLLDMGVKNENKLLENFDIERLKTILEDKNYTNAVRYASGQLADRIKTFQAQLFDGSRWWKLFLREMGAKSEGEIVERLDAATLAKMDASERLHYADTYADEELRKTLFSFRFAIYDRLKNDMYPDEEKRQEEFHAQWDKRADEAQALAANLNKQAQELQQKAPPLREKQSELQQAVAAQKPKADMKVFLWGLPKEVNSFIAYIICFVVPLMNFYAILSLPFRILLFPILAGVRAKARNVYNSYLSALTQTNDAVEQVTMQMEKLTEEMKQRTQEFTDEKKMFDRRDKVFEERMNLYRTYYLRLNEKWHFEE